MAGERVERRLVAILAADVVGYSRLVARDEEATLATLAAYRTLIGELVAEHSGRVFGTAGDGFLAEFASAVQAVRMAVALQRALKRRNSDLPDDRRLEFRIGVNLGDVVVNGNDLLGNGVNIAARVQEVAEPAGICITAAVRDQIEGKLDFVIDRVGDRSLKNIPHAVTIYRVDWDTISTTRDILSAAAPVPPDRPSIAVLPFVNMSGDREQEYMADGITEDVITGLSHYRWFLVIARNSTFAYKGKAVDVKQIARELNVRFVLEGSVRVAGSRLRATAQLIDAETGMHLLAERFDRDIADIFALQDDITQSVVAAIEPEMLLTEGRRALRKNPANLDAFDRCMRGIWHFQQFQRDENREAEMWLRGAIERDPSLALAHMCLARALNTRIWWGWSKDIDHDLADEWNAAERAVALDARNPYCHYALSLASMLTRRNEQSLAAAQRAIGLNPNFALGFFALGWTRIYLGRASDALVPMMQNLRLNPHDNQSETFLGQAALAHYHLGSFDEAAELCRRALRVRRHHFMLRTLAAALGQMGRRDQAGPVLAELRETMPPNAARHWEVTMPYAHAPSRAFFEEGLRMAGFDIRTELQAREA